MTINWQHFAEINGLTPEQFCKEILTAAAYQMELQGK
jgi:hypothetical protein